LDLVLVVRLAREPDHRPAGDRPAVAAPGILLDLAISITRALARGTSPDRPEIRELIIRMARDNFLWGAPRIHGELLKLGVSVPQATVSRYMPDPRWRRSQSWQTFIRNQAAGIGLGELMRRTSVGDFLGTNARSWWNTAPLRIVRLITSLFSNLHLRPAWPRAILCQRCNSPRSELAVPVAHAAATSPIIKREAELHAVNLARERVTRTRAPPRRGVAIMKINGARLPVLSHSKVLILEIRRTKF
jgi:hypothetical protein